MALTKEQKNLAIDAFSTELKESKIVVAARYQGLGVKQLQDLRKQAKAQNISISVIKNRLALRALTGVDGFKEAKDVQYDGMLMYAFGKDDEVAPAQLLAQFAKENPSLELFNAVDVTGQVMDQAQVSHLASLPSKDQLRGQLVGTLAAPMTGFVRVISGNMSGLVNVLNARKEQLESA